MKGLDPIGIKEGMHSGNAHKGGSWEHGGINTIKPGASREKTEGLPSEDRRKSWEQRLKSQKAKQRDQGQCKRVSKWINSSQRTGWSSFRFSWMWLAFQLAQYCMERSQGHPGWFADVGKGEIPKILAKAAEVTLPNRHTHALYIPPTPSKASFFISDPLMLPQECPTWKASKLPVSSLHPL